MWCARVDGTLRGCCLVTAAAIAAACGSGPTVALPPGTQITHPDSIDVVIADSVQVEATAVDQRATPIALHPSVVNLTPDLVAISGVDSSARGTTRVWVRGLAFGIGIVRLSVGDRDTTMHVYTRPYQLVIGAAGDSIASGDTAVVHPVAEDANRDSIGIPADSFWFTPLGSSGVLEVDSLGGTIVGHDTGIAEVTLHGPRGMAGFRLMRVFPREFTGVITPSTGTFADTVTVEAPPSAPWLGDESVSIGGATPLIARRTPNEIQVLVADRPVGPSAVYIERLDGARHVVISGAPFGIEGRYTPHSSVATALDISTGPSQRTYYLSIDAAGPEQWLVIRASASDLSFTLRVDWQHAPQIVVAAYDQATQNRIYPAWGGWTDTSFTFGGTVPNGDTWQMYVAPYAVIAGLPEMLKITVSSP